ncbi:MAG: tRNA (adenosine(37)-N6)-threonylcarbamoyltransferase complex dimerization subunit type 1 TsaB, partial [Fluviibacter sp.]
MIKLLSLETSTDRGGFCLWSSSAAPGQLSPDQVLSVTCPTGQPHAETLLPLLRGALAEVGWQLNDLDAIIYDAGPGMFTGLRVAAALAQGLAVAIEKPLVPVSSLEALAESAYQLTGDTHVLTLLDARMSQIYAAAWQRTADLGWQPTLNPCLVNPDALSALAIPDACRAVAGTALNEYPEAAVWCREAGLKDAQARHPTAEALAHVGVVRYLRG